MASKGSHSPVKKSHEQARLSCCAACGKGGAELVVTPALEELIRRFATCARVSWAWSPVCCAPSAP